MRGWKAQRPRKHTDILKGGPWREKPALAVEGISREKRNNCSFPLHLLLSSAKGRRTFRVWRASERRLWLTHSLPVKASGRAR